MNLNRSVVYEDVLGTHFEVLGLEAQVIGLGFIEPSNSSKISFPELENNITFELVERKITKHKIFVISGIGVTRILIGGPNPQITCSMTLI